MSPASSGVLEVERYIGACLFSSNNHQGLNRKKFQANGSEKKSPESKYQRCPDVFGGIPLVYPSRGRSKSAVSSLSKLAVHTHGVPLILTTNSSGMNSNSYSSMSYRNNNSLKKKEYNYNHLYRPSQDNNNNNKNDSASVTSDSSSISTTSSSSSNSSLSSENTCLPRIIKPRKRRKKDRKPHVFNSSFMQSSPLSSQARIVPYFLQAPIYSLYHHHHDPSHINSSYLFEEREEIPNLQHSFDDLDDFDLNGNQSESGATATCCQCRYCEPEGIWDFDSKLEDVVINDKVMNYCFPRRLESSISVDSQSSSVVDSLSSLSLDDGPLSPSCSPRVSRDLEVSTEIVTSMNGQHRDLEIKFFSTVVQQEN